MRNVANCADIDSRLAGDDFRVQGRNLVRVKVVEGLPRQMNLRVTCLLLTFDDFFGGETNELEIALLGAVCVDLGFSHFTYFFK